MGEGDRAGNGTIDRLGGASSLASVLDDIFGPEPRGTPHPAAFDWTGILDPSIPTRQMRASRAVARAPILRKLERRIQQDLRSEARLRRFDTGAVLAAETEPRAQPPVRDGDLVYVVVSGWCKAVRSDPDGRVIAVDVRGPGEIAGLERLAMAWGPTTAGPQARFPAWLALGPVEAVPFPSRLLRRAIEASPGANAEAHLVLGERIEEIEMAALFALRSVGERLLRELHGLAHRYGARRGAHWTVEVPLAQGDMAALVGATRETANRALRSLAAAGEILLERGRPVLVRCPDGPSTDAT